MSSVPESRIDSVLLVNPAHRINTKYGATISCSECTPLLAPRRPARNGKQINYALLLLGIILFGGITAGGYLLVRDNRSIPVKFVFDMVDRSVWNLHHVVPAMGPYLIGSNVRHIYIMQTNGLDCYSYEDCVAVVQKMQTAAMSNQNSSLPYNFLIGGDGETYEIRGWSEQSGFSFVPHNSSLTIGILGSFNSEPPPACQLAETYALISESLRRRKIMESYKIYGIRNASVSETDGAALFNAISKWDHWDATVNVPIERNTPHTVP